MKKLFIFILLFFCIYAIAISTEYTPEYIVIPPAIPVEEPIIPIIPDDPVEPDEPIKPVEPVKPVVHQHEYIYVNAGDYHYKICKYLSCIEHEHNPATDNTHVRDYDITHYFYWYAGFLGYATCQYCDFRNPSLEWYASRGCGGEVDASFSKFAFANLFEIKVVEAFELVSFPQYRIVSYRDAEKLLVVEIEIINNINNLLNKDTIKLFKNSHALSDELQFTSAPYENGIHFYTLVSKDLYEYYKKCDSMIIRIDSILYEFFTGHDGRCKDIVDFGSTSLKYGIAFLPIINNKISFDICNNDENIIFGPEGYDSHLLYTEFSNIIKTGILKEDFIKYLQDYTDALAVLKIDEDNLLEPYLKIGQKYPKLY